MSASQTVTFYLDDDLRPRAEIGAHNFIRLMQEVLEDHAYQVDFAPEDAAAHHTSGRAITHMTPPPPGGLVFRRVYAYPFWAIEATAERWSWDVARAAFDPQSVDGDAATRFANRWRKRLFPDATTQDDGFLYIPLQGHIQRHRSFQTCTPLDMVHQTAVVHPDTEIRVSLHPKEHYSSADRQQLQTVMVAHDNITLTNASMEHLLPCCAAVVTQNSSVAYFGNFFRKPAILFADIDFHHIALKGSNGLARWPSHRPDYDRYIYWFWMQNSVNAGRPEAKEKIAGRFRRFGWFG